ncbi:MAG: hypothetical protein ACOYLB_17045 [Phototrophicaceae bacterium]
MPTPFTHLVAIHGLLQDSFLSNEIRLALSAQQPAFLLGSVIADARIPVRDSREATHFYSYVKPITTPPWRVMLEKHPTLIPPQSDAHRAFLAGYVAHLAMDTVWTLDMLAPHFVQRDWGKDQNHRFFMLHFLLVYMDERDQRLISPEVAQTFSLVQPQAWLPFMSPAIMLGWRKLIHEQIKPNGTSDTLNIIGERIGCSPNDMRCLLDDAQWMHDELWAHLPLSTLQEVEERMLDVARQSVMEYWNEFAF